LIGGAPKAFFGGSTWNGSTTGPSFGKYIGSMQEIRYHFGELLSHNTLKKHALAPFMYSGNTLSSSYENLIFRAPLGSNDKEEDESSFHPNIDVDYINPSNINSNITAPGGTPYVQELYKQWQEIVETHHLPTPDTVGASMTSEKVRIDEGTVDDNILSPFTKGETSTLDRQPQDFEDLGIFFSPTDEINEDILYTLGSFRMDDYIGSPLPSAQSSILKLPKV
jgi:hypothetical protein